MVLGSNDLRTIRQITVGETIQWAGRGNPIPLAGIVLTNAVRHEAWLFRCGC
jgi:hypothetical protein